jgi:hypothetical protein
MSDMRKILEAAEAEATGTLDETVGASLVDRMASAMLSAPKLEVLAARVFEDDAQRQMFDGMITEPLRALIAKALDAAGATVSGGLLAKAGREMKGVARGGMSAESVDVAATMAEILEPMEGGEVYSEDKVTDGWKGGDKVPPGYRVVFGKLRKVGARGPGGMQLPTTPGEMLHAINKMKKGGKKKPSESPPAGRSAEQAAADRKNAGRKDAEWMKHGDLFRM